MSSGYKGGTTAEASEFVERRKFDPSFV